MAILHQYCSSWPPGPLPAVPDETGAAVWAERIRRETFGESGATPPIDDLTPLLEAAGASFRPADLGAAFGGEEALLIPVRRNRFVVAVDPTPRGGWRSLSDERRAEITRHRTRFRVGHELAHTFFYERAAEQTPVRHLPASHRQERFCDAFSRALFVPPAAAAALAPKPESIVRLQRTYDVSMELAARAFASAHPALAISLWFAPSAAATRTLELQWRSSMPQSVPEKFTASTVTWLPHRNQLIHVDAPQSG